MYRVSVRFASILVLLLGVFTAPAANAWWNEEWQFRKELTLDLSAAGANISANATDVPVLVRLSIANFPYFNDARPDGADLRFIAADDKTPLKFHLEKWDAQAQIALLWVRVPQITGGVNADKLFLYYGNPEGASAGDAAGSYDAGQSLVYHFGAPPPAAQDSTGFKSEPQNFTAEITNASLIGSGLRLDGTKPFTAPAAPQLKLTAAQGYTVSAWLRPEGAQQSVVVSLQEGGRELALGLNGERAYARWRDGGREVVAAQAAGSVVGEWHHVALRAASGKLVLFVDGVEAGQVDIALQDVAGSLAVGAYRGEMDELQVANTARSDSWLRAAATSQGMVAPLLVYGSDAQKEGGEGPNYFATTMRNVTFDGWLIIGLLAVMFVLSMLIMLFKSLYLSRVAKGNAKFLAEFHRNRSDPAVLERGVTNGNGSSNGDGDAFEPTDEVEDARFGSSTLWRLYHHGMREALGRLDDQRKAGKELPVLTAQSIEAIRATMDASQARMGQSLTSKMVWLTISISGGPFLGLLGTVVGVMIVFAGIAASGDVNINAIAPGTAAALAATVAGLAVAIPCLFGYNYLNTRIKDIATDMRVFVDEFVARLAETYT
jgi:biopolymer transport protein ExbB